ncbi:MAG: UTP--glucose-1-phosphate uridylyltransferase GalU [Rhodospirillales bacterium]|nr:UTP--glucose-1-phosphate uridylyltransferase GalU [Rhodospirillales bacterium]
MKKVKKAIFPVAGLGTRFLPATKAIPKELLPVVDQPVINYAIEEAREAGIEKFIFIVSRGKSAIQDYFDHAPELEQVLELRDKRDALQVLRCTEIYAGDAIFVRQPRPLGLGHAIWCARNLIQDEPFAVLLPDDIVQGERACMAQLIEAYDSLGGSVIAVQQVPKERTSRYGILDPGERKNPLIEVKGLIEKPAPGRAPSDLAVIGRYILDPTVFDYLDLEIEGARGEIQITDAINNSIGKAAVHGFLFEGTRYDCGDKLGFLKANIVFGLKHSELGPGLKAFLKTIDLEG